MAAVTPLATRAPRGHGVVLPGGHALWHEAVVGVADVLTGVMGATRRR